MNPEQIPLNFEQEKPEAHQEKPRKNRRRIEITKEELDIATKKIMERDRAQGMTHPNEEYARKLAKIRLSEEKWKKSLTPWEQEREREKHDPYMR